MIPKLPCYALFHLTFLGIIITIYFIVKLRLYNMGLPNQGNTKLRKKLSCPQGVNFSRKFTLGMLLLTRTQEKKNEETFVCLFVFKMFFLSLVHCHIFQVIFCQLADKTLLLSKMDLWCFFFIYYFPFLFKFYRVNSLESRGHNRLYFSSRPWREVT